MIPMPHDGSETSSPPDRSRPATSTSAASPIFMQLTLPGFGSATFLRESADGLMPCDSQGGPTTDLFGQEVAHASPSAAPARARQPMTNATCGLRGWLSSASADLQSSLESRLRRQLDGAGSTLFSLTWSRKGTPAGRPYFQLAVSGRPISETDSGSWRTPKAGEEMGRYSRVNGKAYPSLYGQALLASWPTPCSQQANGEPEAFLERKRRAVAKGSTMGVAL